MPKLTKAFDRIHMVSDKVFLAHCTCNGDVCQCTDPDGLILTPTIHANKEGTPMKFSEIKAAVASQLSLAEKQALFESLAGEIQAAAVDGPKKRLAAVSAAAVSTNQRTKEAYKTAIRGLDALGVKIDAIAASGDINQLDKLMKEQGWTDLRKIGLKTALAICGAA
jgi:hypothetical protein